jgi:pathogenesis-related protein 1
MKSVFQILIILGFSIQSMAQLGEKNTGSRVSASDASFILEQHSKARSEVGVPLLHWNQKLAAYAQAWATFLAEHNNGNIKHRNFAGEDGYHYGENIFWGSSAAQFSARDASAAWYSEKAKYTYTKLSDDNWFSTGHYTQMVWSQTKEMGAGVAVCPNGAIIVVANYFPAGNSMSQFPY